MIYAVYLCVLILSCWVFGLEWVVFCCFDVINSFLLFGFRVEAAFEVFLCRLYIILEAKHR